MKTLYFNNNVIVYNTRPIFDLLIIIISREIKNNHLALIHSVQCFLDHISWKQVTDGTLLLLPTKSSTPLKRAKPWVTASSIICFTCKIWTIILQIREDVLVHTTKTVHCSLDKRYPYRKINKNSVSNPSNINVWQKTDSIANKAEHVLLIEN